MLNQSEIDVRPIRPLKKGGVIGLTALASPSNDSQIESATKYLESIGYKTHHGKSLDIRDFYTAGSAADRAFEFQDMFEDESIDAIFCIRGGFGSMQILPFLDFSIFKENPKLLVGYSDITALQLALLAQSQLPSIHGFMPGVDTEGSKADSFTEQYFWELVESGKLHVNFQSNFDGSKLSFSGNLLGGNLSIVSKLIGTPYSPSFRNSIFFFEDIGERLHKVEGYLWQLNQSGYFKNAQGVLFGDFQAAESEEFEHIPSLEELSRQTLSNLSIPMVHGLPFGHIKSKIALPFGAFCSVSLEDKISIKTETSLFQS